MLDATRDNNEKYNVNMLQGLDTHNQNIGLDTPLDKMFYQNGEKSVNPMHSNWGGKKYTQKAIERGDFEGRYVYKNQPLN